VLATVALIVVFKGTLSAGLTLAFGYRGRTAIATGALLGQSAEFSFLMARVGTDLGEVSGTVFGVMLAAAAVSIVLAPFVQIAAQPLGAFLERRLPIPAASRIANEAVPADLLRGHVILCGYGRVGRVIGSMLIQRDLEVVVVEQDGGVVHELRAQGLHVLHGSASNANILDRAGLATARVLVVATPDPLSTRQIIDYARRHNPAIDIVVRTHSNTERRFLESRGANEAVVGELELALEMARHVLVSFGTSAEDAQRELGRLRQSDNELG
jgi:CPA2 family monovalent cation:H+ antiporter-2